MTITALPSRAALDLGAALTNARAPVANELSAVNVEKIKDWIISLASEVGLSDGSTAGSLREAVASAVGFSVQTVTYTGAVAALVSSNAIVLVDATGGEINLSLPAAASSAGRVYLIRKIAGTGGDTITLTPDGTDEIEGAVDLILPDGDQVVEPGVVGFAPSWLLFCDGTSWRLGPKAGPLHVVRAGDPTTTDNAAKGFGPGSVWITSTGDQDARVWTLRSVDAGDALWLRLDACVSKHYSASGALPEGYDATITVDTTSGVVVLDLPSGADNCGRQFLIQRINPAGTNKITLNRTTPVEVNGVDADFDLPDSGTAAIGRWHAFCDVNGDWWVG